MNRLNHDTIANVYRLFAKSSMVSGALASVVFTLAGSIPAGCQDDRALALRQNVVRVAQGGENGQLGFGFVVAEDGGFIYIVTANHVIAGDNTPDAPLPVVYVVFYTDQAKQTDAEVLEHQVDHDLALIRVQTPADFHWTQQCLAPAEEESRHTHVWFIGRDATWYVPPVNGEVSSDGVDANRWLQVDISELRPGSSGGPLVTSTGIIGMVEAKSADDTKVLSTEFIEAAVKGWGYQWQLEEGPPQIQGTWNGDLTFQVLPTVFHLNAGGTGTLDSTSQQLIGVPLLYSIQGSAISVSVPSLSGSYVGSISQDSMSGVFSQNGGNVPLQLTRNAGTGDSGSAQGDWQGTLRVSMPLVFHLDASGGHSSDSPQQNSFNIPTQYTMSGGTITITVPSLSVTYVATVTATKMTGTFTQHGQSFPFELVKQ